MNCRRTWWCLIFLLVIISLHSLRWVPGTFHENQSAREEFISIDCGIAPGSGYKDDETQIFYTSDAEFIDTGINYNVSMEYVDEDTNQHLMNVRSFPEGDRNCYTLRPVQGKNHKYLIRAGFMYGNYDSKNQPPVFKLYLGVDEWDTVNITDAYSIIRKDIVHIPITDYIDVCLVNAGSGTPFISVLELRELNDWIYGPAEPGSLLLYIRWDFGIKQEEPTVIRNKSDIYDRIQRPFTSTWWSWESINSSLVSSSFSTSDYKLSRIVMATDATPTNEIDAIKRIKSFYAVSKNWQGDPCLPMKYHWDGLTCSHDTSPTIISLNLSSSNLSGNILPSFLSLKSLQNLDLSHNNLTGPVPEFFAYLPSLTTVNLIGNNLTGSVPQAVNDKFKDGTLSLGGNPNLCPSDSCQGKFFLPVLISILSAIVILIIIATLAIIQKLTKQRETKEMVSEYPKEGSLKSGNFEFTLSDVASITNDFSCAISRGESGQVYLGILEDGTQVAVKVHSPSSKQGLKAFRAEVELLMRVRHKNLVPLIGYYNDGENMALIYEYISNGNLQQKLSGREADVLNWEQRLQIAVDAAQGLECLHNGCKPPIVHRDMKSSNILLTETLQAKIADFGMSRDLESLSADPVGTPGYLDPEYQSKGNLNKKSDVYSFGIVLLELITGQPAIKNPRSIHIVGWVGPMIERGDIRSIVDPRLQGDFNTNSAWKVVEIALACVASTGMQRPDMSRVLADLKECLETEVASRRIHQSVDSHSNGSGNFLEDSPLFLGPQSTPHARMTDKEDNGLSEPTTTAEPENPPHHQEPPQDTKKPDKINVAFSIWPPTQQIRDAIINRLIEILTTPFILAKRYGALPADEASATARLVEEEAYAAASGSPNADDDGIEILQVYSRGISKRMLEAVKTRAASGSTADDVPQSPVSASVAASTISEEISSVKSEFA